MHGERRRLHPDLLAVVQESVHERHGDGGKGRAVCDRRKSCCGTTSPRGELPCALAGEGTSGGTVDCTLVFHDVKGGGCVDNGLTL